MPFGLSVTGFSLKRLADVLADLKAAARAQFGPGVNTESDGALGILLGVLSAPLAELWELAQRVWSSQFPSTAEGVQLDAVAELSNVVRLAADESEFWGRFDGTDGTTVPASSIAEHPDSADLYESDVDVAIDAAAALIVDVLISANAAGAWPVTIGGTTYTEPAGGGSPQATADLLAAVINRTPADLPIASNNQATREVVLSAAAGNVTAEFPVSLGIRVFGSTGGVNDGVFTVRERTFDGTQTTIRIDEDIPQAAPVALGNVRKGLTAWTATLPADPADTAEGDPAADTLRIKVYLPAEADDASLYAVAFVLGMAPAGGTWALDSVGSPGLLRALETGPQAVNQDTVFTLVSGVSGWTGLRAALGADVGRDVESDAALRLRRLASLQQGGTTVDAIRAALLALPGVDSVRVNENDTDAVVGTLAAHSVQAVVEGGLAADIGRTLWEQKAAGIATNGARAVDVTDAQGISHTMLFDRVTTMRIIVVVHSRALYTEETLPTDAAALIAAAVAAQGNTLGIDEDVIAARFFGTVFGAVDGLQDLAILVREFTGATSYPVVSASAALDQFVVTGDASGTLPAGGRFTVEGNTAGDNGAWTVLTSVFGGVNTTITVAEDVLFNSGASGTVFVAVLVNAIADAERATFDADDVQVTLP